MKALFAAVCAVALTAACSSPRQGVPPMRLWTQDLAVRITSDPAPPRAREPNIYRVEVRDRTSGQPIEGGEGRVYATSRDGASAWDGLTPGPQPGTYYAKLNFVTAGDWAMGLQFRRDSAQKIETMDDWRTQVSGASGEAR